MKRHIYYIISLCIIPMVASAVPNFEFWNKTKTPVFYYIDNGNEDAYVGHKQGLCMV